MNKEKMNQEAIEYLFLKMSAHYRQFLPSDERSLNFMKQEYLRELQYYKNELVFNNLTKHIHKNKYPPTVADLVEKPKKEESILDRIPSYEESQAEMKKLEYYETADPEYVDQQKKIIMEHLRRGEKIHAERVAKLFEQQG